MYLCYFEKVKSGICILNSDPDNMIVINIVINAIFINLNIPRYILRCTLSVNLTMLVNNYVKSVLRLTILLINYVKLKIMFMNLTCTIELKITLVGIILCFDSSVRVIYPRLANEMDLSCIL